jgi:hypothetical protein
VTNEEGVTFIYTGLGRCLFRTGVSSSRVDLSSGNYIFTLSFSCGADFTSGALYFFFIIILWGRLLFWDLLISSEASLICSMVSFDFLASSSLRKVVPEVNTSRCYQKHQQKCIQANQTTGMQLTTIQPRESKSEIRGIVKQNWYVNQDTKLHHNDNTWQAAIVLVVCSDGSSLWIWKVGG